MDLHQRWDERTTASKWQYAIILCAVAFSCFYTFTHVVMVDFGFIGTTCGNAATEWKAKHPGPVNWVRAEITLAFCDDSSGDDPNSVP